MDVCYSSTITPKMLADLLSEKKTISFAGCFLQMYFFIAFATTECITFGLMAYDRYVAICNPLRYSLIMSRTVCLKMAAGSFTAGLLNSMVHTGYVSSLPFCGSRVIHHFFCDSPPLFKLSCSDTHLYEVILSTFAGVNMVGTLLVILASYGCILFSIFRMHSGEGRCKAFSTCASHLTAIILFYSTSTYTYLRPSSSYSLSQDKVASVFYTVVIPMLNPLIYSLRNKEVKKALWNAVPRTRIPSRHPGCGKADDLSQKIIRFYYPVPSMVQEIGLERMDVHEGIVLSVHPWAMLPPHRPNWLSGLEALQQAYWAVLREGPLCQWVAHLHSSRSAGRMLDELLLLSLSYVFSGTIYGTQIFH
ncbi:olfactory receptor 5F1 [Camelus ferus]|nr:olfactory receptor 5F1 [Camelus ferus]